MEGIIEYVLGRIEAELKQKKISKKRFAEMLGRREAWLHSVFAFRRQLKAADFLKMLAILKTPCEKVLPPDLAAEIGTVTLDEYFSRLIGREIDTYFNRRATKASTPESAVLTRGKKRRTPRKKRRKS